MDMQCDPSAQQHQPLAVIREVLIEPVANLVWARLLCSAHRVVDCVSRVRLLRLVVFLPPARLDGLIGRRLRRAAMQLCIIQGHSDGSCPCCAQITVEQPLGIDLAFATLREALESARTSDGLVHHTVCGTRGIAGFKKPLLPAQYRFGAASVLLGDCVNGIASPG
jgi:hypothetical protein